MVRRDPRMLRSTCAGLFLAACGAVVAQDLAPEPGSAPDLNFAIGNDLWLPAWPLAPGDDWLALVCADAGCELVAATLTAKVEPRPSPRHPVGMAGQRLHWQLATPSSLPVIAWLRRDPALAWLLPGALQSAYPAAPQPAVIGPERTLEILLTGVDGREERLRPMLTDREAGTAGLYLDARGQRQWLGELWSCLSPLDAILAAPPPPRSALLGYLLWAGDLDRDGLTDYLIDSSSPLQSRRWYLSSRAEGEALVGMSGYGHPDAGIGCDE